MYKYFSKQKFEHKVKIYYRNKMCAFILVLADLKYVVTFSNLKLLFSVIIHCSFHP